MGKYAWSVPTSQTLAPFGTREAMVLSLKLKLSTKVEEKRDLTYLKELLSGNFEEIYNRLDKIEKRALWRSFIKSLVVDPDNYHVKVNFL